MCHTNYISNLMATTPAHCSLQNKVQVSMKRSDGEIFIANLTMLSQSQAEKVRTLFNYLEELRTCSCTKDTVCEKHSNLRKI